VDVNMGTTNSGHKITLNLIYFKNKKNKMKELECNVFITVPEVEK
jgi:hypothetical protein